MNWLSFCKPWALLTIWHYLLIVMIIITRYGIIIKKNEHFASSFGKSDIIVLVWTQHNPFGTLDSSAVGVFMCWTHKFSFLNNFWILGAFLIISILSHRIQIVKWRFLFGSTLTQKLNQFFWLVPVKSSLLATNLHIHILFLDQRRSRKAIPKLI